MPIVRSTSETGGFQHTAARRRLGRVFQTTFSLRSFNTQPPEGGWTTLRLPEPDQTRFQHTAARRRLAAWINRRGYRLRFQHTAARRRLGLWLTVNTIGSAVSTHSRPKAAGFRPIRLFPARQSFNTQPPEGGWLAHIASRYERQGFNTQPPEGGWQSWQDDLKQGFAVSTHSRPKAAGSWYRRPLSTHKRFNTQPPEGGWL